MYIMYNGFLFKSVWNSLSFLQLMISIFEHFLKFLSYYLLNYHSGSVLLSLLKC